MIAFRFLPGRSSGTSSRRRPIPSMSLSLSQRTGAGRADAPVTHGCHRIRTGCPVQKNDRKPARTGRSPPAAADFCFLLSLSSCGGTGNLGTSMPMLQRKLPFPLCLRTATDSTTLCQLEHRNLHLASDHPTSVRPVPLANVGICATMGLIPSRRSAHDHTVDCRCS
jgi:hypothetical protein